MMIDLKDMQCLAALARHRHFARAAESCGLSQPAFSMRIRALEDRLGLTVVRRGNRFQGFTPEGDSVVEHSRRILDDVRAMEQDLKGGQGVVAGQVTLGVIPTAAAWAAHMVKRLKAAHPGITARIATTTALEVQAGVVDGKFDAGLSYGAGVSADLIEVAPLYDETYVLLCPRALAPRSDGTATWAEAADLSLVLLEPDMQNRQILDRVFEDARLTPRVIAETSGHSAALVMAVEGLAATVVPKDLVDRLGPFAGTVALPLTDPEVTKSVGLLTPRRARGLALLEALKAVATSPEEV